MIDEVTAEELRILFIDAVGHHRLSPWEQNFCESNAERLRDFGLRMNVSPKVLVILQRIWDRIYRAEQPTIERPDDAYRGPHDFGTFDLFPEEGGLRPG